MRTLLTGFIVTGIALLNGCGGAQPPIGVPGISSPGTSTSEAPDGTYTVLHNFKGGHDGKFPSAQNAPLVNKHGLLYGTTEEGGTGCEGSSGCGTIFSVAPGGPERVIYAFKGAPDAGFPAGPPINFNRDWYGLTSRGGASNDGAVFKVNNSGHERVVYSFKGGNDGSQPFGGLIKYHGLLYGTTSYGGKHRLGTIFSVSSSGVESVVHSFGFHDGQHPYAGLTELKGTLYGTTTEGGADDFGAVFSISSAGKERVIYSFKYGTDGASPQASLTATDGELYGTTTGGGGQGYIGTVFEVSPSGKELLLHRFQESLNDGIYPQSQLVYLNGTLYGTTSSGGKQDLGIVFSVTLSGKERVLHNFRGAPPRGEDPAGGLAAIDNSLYGMTSNGGTGPCYKGQGCGTIFTLTL